MAGVESDWNVKGTTTAANAQFASGALAADKHDENLRRKAEYVVHERDFDYQQPSGTAVVAESKVVGTFFATATIVEVAIVCETKPVDTGTPATDRKFTVDVLKGNQSSGFASILPGGTPITVDTAIASRQVQFVVPTTTAAARGDQLKVSVAVSGSTGTQGQGLSVRAKARENPAVP